MTDAASSPTTTGSASATPRPVSPTSAAQPVSVEPVSVEAAVLEPTVLEPALVDDVDVDAVARAVRACAGVSDLYAGRFGEIGSYFPGRRIGGVRVDDNAVTVQVRARWGYSPRDVFTQIAAVTATLRHGRALNLVLGDIDDDLAATNTVTTSGTPTSIAVAATIQQPPALESATRPPLPESSPS